jgi:hypothetical protein
MTCKIVLYIYVQIMQKTRENLKLSFDLKTFIIIFTSFGSISFRWASIVNKLDNVAIAQAKQWQVIEQLITKRDSDHKIIDQQIARIDPTVRMILKKMWL